MTDFDPSDDRTRAIIGEAVRKCLSERVEDTDDVDSLSPLIIETYKSLGLARPAVIKFESPLKGCLAVGQINTLSEIQLLTRDTSLEVTKELVPVLHKMQPDLASWESKVSEDDGWGSSGRGVPIEPLSPRNLNRIDWNGEHMHPSEYRTRAMEQRKLQDCVYKTLYQELGLETDATFLSSWFLINNDINELIFGQVANDVLTHIHKQIERPITHKILVHKYARAIRQACRSAHPGVLWEKLPLRQVERSIGRAVPNLPYVQLSSKIGAFWIFKKVCIITSKPKVILMDNRGRLHNEQGPSIVYPDGWGVYAWHGVRVPSYVVEDSSQISVRKINTEPNAEVRRVLIERYGFARFLHESGAQLLDEQLDNLGHPIRLYRQEIAGDEPLVMVEVTNSTPELMVQADGSKSLQYKRYTLRVPPNIVSSREAIAWTFDLPVSIYNPEKET